MRNLELIFIAATLPVIFFCPFVACCLLGGLAIRFYVRGPMYRGNARDISGKNVVITGANTGIGKETARDLASRGANVIILCRDTAKGERAVKYIKETTGNNNVQLFKLDLASLESVRSCAKEIKSKYEKIHILINNAGVMMCPQWTTEEGFEMQLGTNHYGHFLLTLLLLDNIKAASPSRIVNVSSLAHRGVPAMQWDDLDMKDNYDPVKAYSQSKLANVLFTNSLANKLEGTGVTAYSLHPGSIVTELTRHIKPIWGGLMFILIKIGSWTVFKDVVLGSQTSIACAIDHDLGFESGKYYSDCQECSRSQASKSEYASEKLWNVSLEKVGLTDFKI